jgi:hypothetical protein
VSSSEVTAASDRRPLTTAPWHPCARDSQDIPFLQYSPPSCHTVTASLHHLPLLAYMYEIACRSPKRPRFLVLKPLRGVSKVTVAR